MSVYNRTPLGDSIDFASMKILKTSYELSPDKNFVTSPLGVLTLITLYVSTSDGKHDKEIMSLLGLIDHKEFLESYSQLIERFSSMDPNPLNFGNEIIFSNNNTPSEELGNNEVKTPVDVNKEWSATVTKELNKFNPDSIVNFLNDIHFQGHWDVSFDTTNEQQFHVDGSTTVWKPMMHALQPLLHHENTDMAVKMIELPYKESKFRMVVVLPDEVEGLPAVLEKISEKGLLDDIFQLRLTGYKVDLSMPKFETKSKINFNNVLPEEVSSVLQRGRPSGLKNRPQPPTSRAMQEVNIKVNEEGATAEASTGRVKFPKSIRPKSKRKVRVDPTIPFKVDRPFLYVILHDDIIILVGTYTH